MSCLFRSLSVFVDGINEDQLRQIICDYLQRNPKIMDDLTLNDILHMDGVRTEDYVNGMRNPSEWGGAIEIKAFCEIYQVGVVVRVRATQKEIVFTPASMANATMIQAVRIEWQGAHYEPILNK